MRIRVTAIAILLILSTSCTMMPEYQKPEMPVASKWPDRPAYESDKRQTSQKAPAKVGWRTFLDGNPVLIKLIKRGLHHNRKLRVAIVDMQRARAKYRIQRSELWPNVDGNATYTNQQTPASVFGSSGGSLNIETYEFNVGMTNYELDLFGRIQSLKQGALQKYLSTVQARRSAQISLIGEIANVYLAYRANQAKKRITNQMLTNQRQFLDLVKDRFDQGISSKMALNRAQKAVQKAQTELDHLQSLIAQNRNALRVLIGGALPDKLNDKQTLDHLSINLPLPRDLKSELLLRRPDVREAEHQLKAANADIGAARAAFFPRVSLTGNYGRLSSHFASLFKGGLTGGAESWNFVPKVSVPIFDGGKRSAELKVAKLRKRQEIARYEKTIQKAFQEVADTLANRSKLEDVLDKQKRIVQSSKRNHKLSRQRYRQGINDFLSVLDSQRELLASRQALVDVHKARLSTEVTLYLTLGGGWREHSAQKHKSSESNS